MMEQASVKKAATADRPHESPAASTLSRTQIKMLGLAMLGGSLEYYEFVIFGLMVPTLSRVFFSSATEPWLSTLQTLAVFAAGYMIRPIGGIFLSAMGDRLGRKRMFIVTLALMATPTMLIGLLPTYAQIGVLSPILLLACRLCQGLAMGGEVPSAMTFVVEHVPERRTGFAIGLMGAGLGFGMVVGIATVVAISHGFAKETVLAYAWRIPFVLGGVFGLLSAALRRFAAETPVFTDMAARKSMNQSMPIRELLTTARPELLIALLASLAGNGIIQTAMVFPATFLQTGLHLPAAVAGNAQTGLIVASVLATPLGGWLMDRFGWTRCVAFTAIALIAALANAYAAPTPQNIGFNMILVGIPCAIGVVMNNHLVRVFAAQIRITGIAVAHNIATAIVGLLPILMGFLTHFEPRSMIFVPGAFALMAVVITPVAIRYRKPLAFHG
jgi:MFS family permease